MKKNILILVLSLFFTSSLIGAGFPESYYEIVDVKKQKEVFLNHLYEMIEKENVKILKDRELVKSTLSNNLFNTNYSSDSFARLLVLQKKYKVRSILSLDEFLNKIDIVPPSLALAQAAVESGWGKSRFVKEANNIYGHWTFGEKGLVPENRDDEKKHKIRIFNSLQTSVHAYMLNLNSNRAYHLFRSTRTQLRSTNLEPTGNKLSHTMKNYSGIGNKYLKMLNNLIDKQKLSKFDNKFYNKLNQNI